LWDSMSGIDSTRAWLHYGIGDRGLPDGDKRRGTSISRGWELARVGFDAILDNRSLILLPLISTLVMGMVTISFLGGYFMTLNLENGIPYNLVLLIVLLYFIASIVMVFFNVALIGAAMLYMEGGDPTVGYGIRFASERLGLIIQWAMLVATVNVLLSLFRRTAGIGGQIASSLAGVAWSVATFFAVPVLAFERLTPIDAIKRNTQVLRSTWRETLFSNLGIWVVFFILGITAFLPLFAAFVWMGADIGLIILAISIIYWIFLGSLYGGVSGVLVSALYRYAVTGKVHPDIPMAVVQNPWTY